ncbi:hypothetical protein AVEN_39522-1 [Araneus ventricosus]|uniref:Integrase catalytic domain-containing protein n=1 Tax=Araneus ventricosus TaxID=182803 RepID=A0A4Y2NJ84_ARAVE|nr:hypothetical protein AVEN_39522-1 [Araneus ventricosus]
MCICVFLCFVSKAVHVEIVSDLISEAFINTLNRFFGRRGKCTKLYSDNGKGCGRLVIRSRPRGRRVPDSRLDSTEEPPSKRIWCTLNPSGPNDFRLVWLGSLERGCQLRCRPRHLTAVQNTRSVLK